MSAPPGIAGMLRGPAAPAPGPAPTEPGLPAGAEDQASQGGASPLAQALHVANQLMLEAIQTGDVPPDALEQINQFAELIAQFAQTHMQPEASGPGAAPAPPMMPPQGA